MFYFFFDNNIEIRLGASPQEADLAIVSINAGGTIGALNQMVLDEYGYNKSILEKIDLKKGYDHYQGNKGKLILFIVTVGTTGTTAHNLSFNLSNCLEHYSDLLNDRKIWIPLMGIGVGGLKLAKSFNITEKIIEEYCKKKSKQKSNFLISIPNSTDGKLLFNSMENKSENKTSIPTNEISKAELSNDVLQLINNTDYKFHLVGSNWGSEDQSDRFYKEGVWENGYGEEKFGDRVNKVEDGDILFNKSTYARHDGTNYLRIKGVAIVTKNPKNSTLLYCKWIATNIKIDIEDLSNYRDAISEPSKEGLVTILFNLDENLLREIFIHIRIPKKTATTTGTTDDDSRKMNPENETSEVPSKSNVTTLAGLSSDTESGADYLEISKDVNAFARVMAAKSFEPPLAIALLGKWGSGKSFFMRKLKEGIQNLSLKNPEEQFCKGIAHVHFNAWSYMDANLWASIVTRIFESLDDYINDTIATEKEKKEIENQLFNKLNVSKNELSNMNKQKESLDNNIQKLQTKKDKLKGQLDKKITSIKTKTLTDIIKKVDEEFNVRNEIDKTLDANPTFVATKEKFIEIVPEKYWDNPTTFYNQLRSSYTFLKAFLHRDSLFKNILWIAVIVLILALTPVITYTINLLISWQDFALTNSQWFTISIIGSVFVRGIDTFIKLKKQIAPFWKIKEDYEAKKANALFEFEQEEKGLRLEIDNFKQEIIQIDSQIQLNKGIKAALEFKLKNALSTEALYTFIEKRANSDDYKKHLGIVSLIRKDFEILSGLLTNHQTELVTNKESQDFKNLFGNKKPLERIILYIDDLDRCPEERVVEVLEAVNLLMAFPLFIVVVGVDPRWVRTALQKKYKNQFKKEYDNEEAISPSNYLEKIFQVPFHLKDAGDESVKGMIKTLVLVKPNIIRTSNEEPPLIEHNDEPDFEPNNETIHNGKAQTENELLIETNRFDQLFKKESIEALDIIEKECEFLQDMSKIIGNNPRAIKRFVNIYRIVKTHEDFNFDKSTEEKELMVIMFLLALSMGDYKHLVKSFEYHLNQNIMSQNPISDYFNSTKGDTDYLLDDKAKILREKLKNLLSINLITLYKIETDLFAIQYHFIKRFTFKNI